MRTTQIASFSKAVAAGTVAAGGPYLFLTVPLGIGDLLQPITGDIQVGRSLYLAMLPLIVALPLVLSASLVVGVPTAVILRKRNWETMRRYVFVGVITGFLIPFGGVLVMGAEWGSALGMGVLGAFSGGVTAFVWAKATAH